MSRISSALLALSILLAPLGALLSYGQNGNSVVTIVDDMAPTSWSDSRGNYCPPGWETIAGMFMCKHFFAFDRFAPNNQRALEDVRLITVGLACPPAYQKLGEHVCAKFVTVSSPDVYTLAADITYGGTYDNGGEGASAVAPRCNPGWDLVSQPYQGGIGMCLRKITALVGGAR